MKTISESMNLILEVEDIKEALLEVANILIQLRDHTKYWEEHYGSMAKTRKKFWEKKADDWIKSKIKDEEDASK